MNTLIDDKIWNNQDLFATIARKVGLNDYSCHDIYSLRLFPYCCHALFISTEINQWANFREAFVYCMMRELFIREEWIKPNQKLSSQTEWEKNDFGWVDECLYFMDNIISLDNDVILCTVDPHKADMTNFDPKTKFNYWCNTDKIKNGEYKASALDIELITNIIQRGEFISLYTESYIYSHLLFGKSDGKYILINFQLVD